VQLTKFNYYSQKYRAILDNIKFLELLIDTPLIKQLEKLQMLSNSLRMPNDIKSIQNRNFRVEPITSSEYFRLYHFDTTTDKNIIEEKYNIFKHNKVSYVIPIKQLNEKQDISFTVEDLPNSEYFIRESTNTNFNTKKKDFLIDFCDKIIETFSNKHHEDIKSYLYHELEMKLGPNTKEICGGVLYKSKDNTDVRTDTMSYNRIKHQVKKWINNDIYKFCHDKKINLNLISCLKEK
jgi:hypothetical protein